MNKKKLVVASIVTILVLTACRFSFNLPGMTNNTDTAPTPVGDAVQVATPPIPTAAPLAPLAPIDLAERDQLLTTLYDHVSQGVVSILVTTADGGGVGSGFVYQTGYVVTNYHVVEGFDDLEVDFPSGFKARGEVIGTVDVRSPDNRPWDQDELDIVGAILERAALAMDNARLLEESQRLASKEAKISEVTAKISSSINMRSVLQTAVEELGRALPGSEIVIQFQTETNKNKGKL